VKLSANDPNPTYSRLDRLDGLPRQYRPRTPGMFLRQCSCGCTREATDAELYSASCGMPLGDPATEHGCGGAA